MNQEITKIKLKDFGITIGILFPLILGIIFPFIYGHQFQLWTLYIGIPLIFLGIFRPQSLIYLYKAWMNLGLVLGWINSRLILGLIFILILIPIAIVMRIFGYDPLKKRFKNTNSYRENKETPIDFTKIF